MTVYRVGPSPDDELPRGRAMVAEPSPVSTARQSSGHAETAYEDEGRDGRGAASNECGCLGTETQYIGMQCGLGRDTAN